MIAEEQRIRLLAAINREPTNPPSPRLSIAERDELRQLVAAGREEDAWGELSAKGNAAFARSAAAVHSQLAAQQREAKRARREEELHEAQLASLRAEPDCDTRDRVGATIKTEGSPDTNGLVAWQRVLLELWPQIAAAYKEGKPTPRDAMTWMKKNGPRDVIPELQPDSENMRWIGLDGTMHTVTLKTIQTRVSEWKKTGKLPA